ncbi:ATP-dependent (S)-NAD(P)H-hydrate dehydratase-like [Argonauta hians]
MFSSLNLLSALSRRTYHTLPPVYRELDVPTLNNNHQDKDLMSMVKSIVPSLCYSLHKGQCGRIAVIGGCQEYTGAPYFAAISALKVGADLSHVFCTSDSAPVIKSYSPELIVHPVLDKSSAVEDIGHWLPKMHSVVIGPGLGRRDALLSTVKEVLAKVISLQIPVVVDADGVYLLSQDPDVIRNYGSAILTPNVIEFAGLYQRVIGRKADTDNVVTNVVTLAEELGNVTIVLKGAYDIISDGKEVLICSTEGSPRRCGGQGDLLSGSMGTFSHWSHMKSASGPDEVPYNHHKLLATYGPTVCAAYAACQLTRECSKEAFKKHHRSVTTSDMIENVSSVFHKLFE